MKKYSQKSWFASDNRKTFATYNAIKSSDVISEPFSIKQAVYDPVNLPLSFYNLLKKSNGERSFSIGSKPDKQM